MQDYNNDRNTFNKRRISKSMKNSLDVVRRIFRSNSDSDPRRGNGNNTATEQAGWNWISRFFDKSSVETSWKIVDTIEGINFSTVSENCNVRKILQRENRYFIWWEEQYANHEDSRLIEGEWIRRISILRAGNCEKELNF